MIPLLVITQSKQTLQHFLEQKNKEKLSNIITLAPQTTEYSIQQIREISIELRVSQPIKRIYVFGNFENSSLEAQNAFLKLLEEPPNNVEFILIVSNPYSLLPTVISRTKIVRLEKSKDFPVDSEILKALVDLTSKKNLQSFNFYLFSPTTNEQTLSILAQMCIFFRERFSIDHFSAIIVKEIISTYQLVKNNNLHSQLAFDHLLIFIAKKYSMK